ncbi:MAG TPA: hypothetical protein VGO47_04260 [Chlamydiales bacterium]|nr:hypothetical protein [Chlamydiales bacterium]
MSSDDSGSGSASDAAPPELGLEMEMPQLQSQLQCGELDGGGFGSQSPSAGSTMTLGEDTIVTPVAATAAGGLASDIYAYRSESGSDVSEVERRARELLYEEMEVDVVVGSEGVEEGGYGSGVQMEKVRGRGDVEVDGVVDVDIDVHVDIDPTSGSYYDEIEPIQ